MASYAASASEGFEVMDKRQHLREIVARLCRVHQEEVLSGFSLAPLVSRSVNVHLLDSALRKLLGVEPPPLQTIRTYADLEALVLGEVEGGESPRALIPGATNVAEEYVPTPVPGGLACGLDMESIANLPMTEDPWMHEFYSNFFTSTEIAYCVAQAHPLRHFAARWCAKEALKKCDPDFLHEKLVNIQVVNDEKGAPLFQLVRTGQNLPHALSMTHDENVAGAIVLHLRTAVPAGGNAVSQVESEKAGTQRVDGSQRGVSTALALAILATVVGGIALLRTFGF
jgi:phosphopantetheine--protein transferase-like protein